MGVFTFTDEYTSQVAAARLFKASILDSHNLIPKLMPQVVKSIEIQGDGGAGSIKHITFAGASTFSSVKSRVDNLNEEALTYKYTVIEGGPLSAEKIESVVFEVKLEPTPEGGSKSKTVSTYHTKGDVELKEEEVKAGKEKALGMYKIIETYLLQNPDAYA